MSILDSWKFWAILSALFASLTAMFGKIGISRIDSNLATWYRTLVIFSLLGIYLAVKKIPISAIVSDRRTWTFLTLSALCTGASWVSYYRALQLGNVSRVAAVDKLSVVLTVFMAFLFLNETITLNVLIGALLILSGSLLMLI